ncbi:MAG: serine/threonine-protein kinase [Polyangia bacterium]
MRKPTDAPDAAKADVATSSDSSSQSPGFAPTAPLSDELLASVAARMPGLAIDEVIAGRYRVVRFLARGGMGEVYEVEDAELNERVALKTIRDERRDGSTEALFLREIQLSRKVTHPNVCRIFDVGHHERSDGKSVVFLTMELVEGTTLHHQILAHGRLSLEEAHTITQQIVAALATAHAAGVVHRDLKSANVMLARTERGLRAVVTDFGLAHHRDDRATTGSGGVVGTPAYMAPEQVEGGAVTERSDLYALGIVMYEMVTGTLPFTGTTPLAIAAKRLTEAAPSARTKRPDLPRRWDEAIATCLERDQAKRPRSARAVLALLETAPGESLRFRRLNRRAPVVRPLFALSLLVAAIAVGLYLRHERRSSLAVALVERGITLDDFRSDDESVGYGVAARNALRCALLGDAPVIDSRIDLPGQPSLGLGATGDRASGTPLHLQGALRVEHRGPRPRLEVSVRVVNPATGRELFNGSEGAAPVELQDAIARLAARLRTAARLPAAQPVDPTLDARAIMTRVQHALDTQDYAPALEQVERAIASEPHVPELYVMYIEALQGLELDIAAGAVTRKLATFRPVADPALRSRVAISVGRDDVVRVVAQLQQLHADQPDDISMGLELARALSLTERVPAARAVCDELLQHARTPAQRLAVRVMRLKVEIAGDRETMVLGEFQAVYDEALSRGLPGLAVSALEIGCVAAVDDDQTRVASTCKPLEALARAHGRVDAVVRADISSAVVAGYDSDVAAYELFDRARVEIEQLGSFTEIAYVEQLIGSRAWERNSTEAANAHYDEAFEFARASHDIVAQTIILLSRALNVGGTGDLASARSFRQRAYELSSDSRDNGLAVFAREQEALESMNAGDMENAVRLFDSLSVPSLPVDDALTLEQYRSVQVRIALERGRDADVDAALAAFDADPPMKVEVWGVWMPQFHRAEAGYERGDFAAMEHAALEGLSRARGSKDQSEVYPLRVLVALGRVTRGGAAPSVTDLQTWKRLLDPLPSRISNEMLRVEMLSLRRAMKEAPGSLLLDLDPLVARLSAPGALLRGGLWARVERLRVYAQAHDPRLEPERAALIADANAHGFVLVARQAAKVSK